MTDTSEQESWGPWLDALRRRAADYGSQEDAEAILAGVRAQIEMITQLRSDLDRANYEILALRRESVSRAEIHAIAELLHGVGILQEGVWDQLRLAGVQSVEDHLD